MFQALDRKPNGHVLKVAGFVKIVQIQNMTQQNHNNCLSKIFFCNYVISYLQYNVNYSFQ